MQNEELQDKITRDEIGDRSMLQSVNKKGLETIVEADKTKLCNVIKAYGNLDLDFGYNQGYNFIVSLLLNFVESEEDAFWCLSQIMTQLDWRDCFSEGMERGASIQESLPEFIQIQCPLLYDKLVEDEELLPFVTNLSQNFIMPIFTSSVPIEISK